MSWHLKGRPALSSLDPSTKYRVVHSHLMTQCANKPLLWVLEELTTVSCVGGLSGPTQKVEYFLCLVARILQICPAPAIVLAMLRQDIHKYVRVAAMLVIRLIGNEQMMNEAVAIGLDDYRKVRIHGDEEELPAVVFTGTNDARSGALASLGSGVGAAKRARSGTDEASEEAKRMEALMKLTPPHYFLWRLDEVTMKLFGIGEPPGGERRILGIPLSPLVEEVDVPPLS